MGWIDPRRLRLAAAILLLAAAVGAGAEREEVRPRVEVALHLKILSYDRRLKERSRGSLVIGVVYRAEGPDAERARDLMAAFRQLAQTFTVMGMTPAIVGVPYDGKTVETQLAQAGATAIYVSPGIGELAPITAAAVHLQAPTLSARRDQVKDGVAIGVVADEQSPDRPKIVINYPAAKALGMDLDPNLLRLAEVLR
jgi:hypothetical protein